MKINKLLLPLFCTNVFGNRYYTPYNTSQYPMGSDVMKILMNVERTGQYLALDLASQEKLFKMEASIPGYCMGNFLVSMLAFLTKWSSRGLYAYLRFHIDKKKDERTENKKKDERTENRVKFTENIKSLCKGPGEFVEKWTNMETKFEFKDLKNLGIFAILTAEVIADFAFDMNAFGYSRNLLLTLILPMIIDNLVAYAFNFYSPTKKKSSGDNNNGGKEISNSIDVFIIINIPLLLSFLIRLLKWNSNYNKIERQCMILVEQNCNNNKHNKNEDPYIPPSHQHIIV